MHYELQDFEQDVLAASHEKPVLVDFWAQWCGPCRILGPILENLAAEQADRFSLVKIETDKHPEISSKYGIRGIPNVKLFSGGEVVDEFTGALPERMLREWLDKAIPDPLDAEVAAAIEMLAKGQVEVAQTTLQSVLERAPRHEKAAAHLARSIVIDDPIAARELVAEIYDNSAEFEIAESVRTLSELMAFLPNGDGLDAAEVRDDFLEAVQSIFDKDFDRAIEGLIAVLRSNRYYQDDAARRIIIALFRLLGEDSPITQRHRRNFDRALY